MAHNTVISAAIGTGDTIVDVDLSLATYPTTGKLPASCLYVSADATTAPTAVHAGNALYVRPGTSATWAVTDNSGSLTVDAPVGTPVFVRLSDGSAAISTLPVSLASVPSHAVTNAGTFAVQVDGAALTSLQLLDDAVSGAGFNITQMNGVNVTMGNGASGTGVQRVTLANDSTGIVALTTSTASIGKLASNSGVTIGAVELAAAQTLATVTTVSTVTAVTTITNVVHVDDNSGSLTVDAPVGTPVFVRLSDGSSAIATLPVSLASVPSHAVTNAGTFAVQAASAGDVAHDAVDSGNPVKQGFKATTALSGLTLVANADRTDGFAGVDGVQITRSHQNLEDIITATPVGITDGSSTSVIAAAGAGIKIYITEVCIANSSASNVTVDLRDGVAGAVKWTFPVPANGGVVKGFTTPLPFSANTAVAADPSAAASTITVSLLGFKSKV